MTPWAIGVLLAGMSFICASTALALVFWESRPKQMKFDYDVRTH